MRFEPLHSEACDTAIFGGQVALIVHVALRTPAGPDCGGVRCKQS